MSASDLIASAPVRHRRDALYVDASRRSVVSWIYAVVSVLLIAVYPLLPRLGRTADFLIVSCSAIVPAVMIVRRSPRGYRFPWGSGLISLILLNLGNLVWYWYVDVKHLPTADGTSSDLLISIGHVFMVVSALSIVFRRGHNDGGGIIDAMIVAMAAGGLLWDLVLLPHMAATNETAAAQASMFLDILLLNAILGALLRLLLTANVVIHALWLLVMSLALSMVGNIIVTMTINPRTGERLDWTNMIFMGTYVCLGLVTLSRSSVLLTQPGPRPADELTPGRLAFLGVALAAIPVIGGGRQLLGADVDGLLVGVGGAAVTLLVMVRIGRLAAQRNRAEKALLHQATHDALTGLPNRREFVTQLTADLERPRSSRIGPVVLFCDLDGFKAINDRFGHVAGDALLIEVSGRLRHCVRESDMVSRFGGDEFLVLCRDASPAQAAELCRRISDVMRVPIILDSETVVIGASIGAVTADGILGAEELIHRADALMYAAKQQRPRGAVGVRTVAA